MTTLIWVLAATLATSFLCSVLEAVFLSLTHGHVALMKSRGEWAGEWLADARRKVDEPIAAILTLNTIAHTVGAVLGGALAADVFGSAWIGVFSAVLTLAVLLLTEIVPKTLGATHWMHLAKPTAYVLWAMIIVMKPILVPLGVIGRAIQPKTSRPTVSRTELEILAEIGRREGALGEDEWQVVRNVFRLEALSVGEVMTPRTDIVAISVDTTVGEAIAAMSREGHLRLPVWEGTVDRVLGVVVIRDLWESDRDGTTSLRSVIRPVTFVPASKAVMEFVPQLRAHHTNMAIVIDEFGGTAGLVTLGDLLAEIVGDIQGDYDPGNPEEFRELGGGLIRVWAGVPLREAGARLAFDPTAVSDGFGSLGGYVFGRLDRIPETGDEVDVGSGVLRVDQMRGRRIETLIFQPADPS